ncbi:hypothetical protein PLICRDRAFT_180747 [Plicaturopsis crispa FD-325 SS-3]|uniref:Uncharacterized protein n=1 Tax=Plicaturopsis crispa FD-325 SS-3 TaxID=944288 RepID=A0A0C9SK44_PLICR|nr:hypothetical protein PLICRDRAFT_180747 [Plicaturopsis crispa FD-325 SS-3]
MASKNTQIHLSGQPYEYLPLQATTQDFAELGLDVKHMWDRGERFGVQTQRDAMVAVLRYFQQHARQVLARRSRRAGYWWMMANAPQYVNYIEAIETGMKHIRMLDELMDTRWKWWRFYVIPEGYSSRH